MKYNRYKLTPQVEKQILTIAKDLPQLQQMSKLGNPLSRIVTKYTGGKTYQKITEPFLVNHVVEMRDRYQKNGQDGIDSYVATVHRIVENSKQQPEEVGSAVHT